MTGLSVGANVEASAGVLTAGEKVLALHKLLDSDISDKDFRALAREVLGPKP